MKITEKMLLDNYDGISKGGTKISKINGENVWWDYRVEENGRPSTVCSAEKAEVITMENDRDGVVEIKSENRLHPSIDRINKDEAELWGTEI